MYSFQQIIEGATDKTKNIIFLAGVRMQLNHFNIIYKKSVSSVKIQTLLATSKKGRRSCTYIK